MKKTFGKGIGRWSEDKLNCVYKYLGAYSNIIKHAGYYEECYFVDGFASTGFCKSRRTQETIKGSAALALTIDPPFSRYFFIETDENKTKELEKLKKEFPKLSIEVFMGDCNTEINKVLQQIKDSTPFIALLDPQAGDLYWDTIVSISSKYKAELLINFPLGMAIKRYMPLTEGKNIDSATIDKLNKIFGSKDWEQVYRERKIGKLSPIQANEKYLDIYLLGLEALGFKYYAVKDLRNSRNAHMYYLIFATRNRRGLEKMKDPFVEKEANRESLFFKDMITKKVYNKFKGKQNISLDIILETMLSGKHMYRAQDFKDALKKLEKEGKLVRINPRPGSRSFVESDLFNIV